MISIQASHDGDSAIPDQVPSNVGELNEVVVVNYDDMTDTTSEGSKVYLCNDQINYNKLSTGHTGEKRFKCDLCKKSFSLKQCLKEHILKHTKEKLNKCDICELSFTHPSTLNKHKRIHSGEKLFNCEFCGKSFAGNISSHKRICTKENPYKCDYCKKTFHTKSRLMDHMELVHKTSKISKTDKEPLVKYVCLYCNERLDTSEKLVIHERLHTESKISKTIKEPIAKYLCSYCNERLDTSEKLAIHERLHTESIISKTVKEPIAKYLCSYCNERLDTSEKLAIHERLHTESIISKTVKEPIVKYLCSYCSEGLDTSEKLVCHERLHTEYKTFTCESCSKVFDNEHAYASHKRSVHKDFMQDKESFNNFVNVNENITDNYEIKTDQEDEIKEEIVIETVETIEEDPLTIPEKEEGYGYSQSFIVFHEM